MMEINNEDAYRDRVKLNYEFSTWAGRTKEGVSFQLSNFAIRSQDLEGWTEEQSEELPATKRQRRVMRYVFSSPDVRGQRLIVTVFECNSVEDAHESLIDVVMTYMAPSLPRCETRGLEIGDVCFGSHGDVNLNVIFARFNILVEVKSASPGPASVDELAKSLDSVIYNQYRKSRGG
jgi:hypothetical protein